MTDLSIKHLEAGMEKLGEEIKEVKWDIKEVLLKIDNLDNKFVTRLEFKSVAAVFTVVVSAIWVILLIIKSK